jgi:hypothetical protein
MAPAVATQKPELCEKKWRKIHKNYLTLDIKQYLIIQKSVMNNMKIR